MKEIKSKPIIKLIRRGTEWSVEFWIGVQGFQLAYSGTKSEAKWLADMLEKAFSRIK